MKYTVKIDNSHWTDEMKRHFLEKANEMIFDSDGFYERSRLFVVPTSPLNLS